MIKYVIQAKRNPANPEQTKYYPQMAPSTPITLAQVVKRIEKRSTVSSADVKAVLDALQYEVVEALADGNSIRLNDLGSFRLTITANGVDSAAEAKKQGARLIKQVNVKFTKSTAMRDALDVRNLDFAPQADIKNAIGGSESGGEGGNEGGDGSEGGGTGDDNSPRTKSPSHKSRDTGADRKKSRSTSHAKKAVLQKNAKSRVPRREAAKSPKKPLQTLKKFSYRTIQNVL